MFASPECCVCGRAGGPILESALHPELRICHGCLKVTQQYINSIWGNDWHNASNFPYPPTARRFMSNNFWASSTHDNTASCLAGHGFERNHE